MLPLTQYLPTYHAVLPCTTKPALLFSNKSDTESNTLVLKTTNGGPQRYRTPLPDTPLNPSGSDDIPSTPLKKKKRVPTFQKIYIYKMTIYKTFAQCSVVQFHYVSFPLCSFFWHFVKFLTRKDLNDKDLRSLSGMPPK